MAMVRVMVALRQFLQTSASFHACGADEAGLLRPGVETQSTSKHHLHQGEDGEDIVKALVPQCKPD